MSTTRKSAAGSGAKQPTDEPSPERAEIEAQIERIRADIAALAEAMKGAGAARLKEARDSVDQLPEEALAQLQAQIRYLEEETRAKVSAQPFQSLGLAALVGFLLGVLWRR